MKSLQRSVWSNGMIQHAFFQAKLFHQLGYKVQMITPKLDSAKDFDFVEQVQEGWLNRNLYWMKSEQDKWKELEFDLFIVWETNLSEAIVNDIRERFGCPVVAMQCGNEGFAIWNEYAQNKDNTIQYSLNKLKQFRYDSLWTTPHYARFKSLYDSLYAIDTKIVPYVWEPLFLEKHPKAFSLRSAYDRLKGSAPVVSVCEPNRDLVTMSLYPILGAHKIKGASIRVYGKKCDAPLRHLDLSNVSYEPRKPMYEILQTTTMVVSHQCMNELNYLYFDCAWCGVPIIHNSPFLKELGWYYKANDIGAIPALWEEIKSLSWVDYLKKVQRDRDLIQSNYFTHRTEALSYFKNAVEALCKNSETR